MRKFIIICFIFILSFIIGVDHSIALTIGGSVRQPLNLTLEDLLKLESISVRLNEVTSDNNFRGVFSYRGVPLKTLLELAFVQKEESGFSKSIDLAIRVRNKDGKTIVLSWGEVFYRNPSDVIIAFSATPIMPYHGNCGSCHQPSFYEPALNQLKRKIGFPKLVVTNDFFTDRSLEDVVHIEVVEPKDRSEKKKVENLFSSTFVVLDNSGKSIEINELSHYRQFAVMVKQVGDGRGYHGLKRFSGVSLVEILRKMGIDKKVGTDTAILATSIDGYRTLISYGELFMTPMGERIMIADKINDKPIKENGKFMLVFPDDISADRTVKAISKIEVLSFKANPKIYIIGMGCADTSLLTLEAISYLGKADAYIAPKDIATRFAKYLGDKPILFDPLSNSEYIFRKNNPNFSEKEIKEKLEKQRTEDMKKIKDLIRQGKSIALLEYGDPTIYGAWQHWLEEYFNGDIEIIPGISAFNAANAMIEKPLGCNGSIILTVPRGLIANEAMLKSVAANGDTIAIFIGLKELKTIVPILERYYSPTTPVNIVYKAGYSHEKRILKTTLGDVLAVTEKEKEQHLGMIYLGPCLKDDSKLKPCLK